MQIAYKDKQATKDTSPCFMELAFTGKVGSTFLKSNIIKAM